MQHYYNLSINAKVSLVVCPVDSFTGRPRSGGNISVLLPELTRKKPVRKADGYYVFTGLPPGSYGIRICSDVYFEEYVEVDLAKLDPHKPVVYISLKPRAYYPFPEGTTLIRASVRDARGAAVAGAGVKAVMLNDNCARAKLSGEATVGGDGKIYLTKTTGKIAAGDVYLIKGKDEKNSEYCRIAGFSEESKGIDLLDSLQYAHPRGALLIPVVETRSDERGEAVLCFREPCPAGFGVKLQFSLNNKIIEKELDVEEGKTFNLGTVVFNL